MSFRLIPSPSSSFPFPHLDQKRHKGIERMVNSCVLSRPGKQEEQVNQVTPGPALPQGLQPVPPRVPPRGHGPGDPWRGDPLPPGLAAQAFPEDRGLMQIAMLTPAGSWGAGTKVPEFLLTLPGKDTKLLANRKPQTCHSSCKSPSSCPLH